MSQIPKPSDSNSDTLTRRLREYIQACCTALWIETCEPAEAVLELAQLCRDEDWRLVRWNLETGLSISGEEQSGQAQDPLSAVRALPSLATADGTTLLVLQNYHRFLQSPEILQALEQQILLGRQQRTFVVVLAPGTDIPRELEKLFVVLEHPLPDRKQLEEIAAGLATEDGDLPAGRDRDILLEAAAGLTRYEAEAAFSLSLVRHGCLQPEAVWELKCGLLRKSGLLNLYRGSADFASLGGLQALKQFCRRSLIPADRSQNDPSPESDTEQPQRPRPRGVLLLSPPGCGKSQFCKALGTETGRPVLLLDVGALMGSLVGQSEERTRQALQIADAMAPCVLFIDEVEKAFAGVSGSQGDSGVSARVFGTVLTWLNDHESDVYVVCTSNDVSRLPPEFARAERFDAVFFLDLPDRSEKDVIWQMYARSYGLTVEQPLPADDQWTGAEIKACCRLAALLNLSLQEAAEHVVPVAATAAEALQQLRQWAGGRCLQASAGGRYQAPGTNAARPRRRVAGKPSLN